MGSSSETWPGKASSTSTAPGIVKEKLQGENTAFESIMRIIEYQITRDGQVKLVKSIPAIDLNFIPRKSPFQPRSGLFPFHISDYLLTTGFVI
jgi:hypothetical protein